VIKHDNARSQQRSLFADAAPEAAHVVRPLERRPEPPGRVQCRCIGCSAAIDPEKLTCRKHWFLVPKALRDAVWRHYRPGQGIGDASAEYLRAAADAIEHVARTEGRPTRNWFRQRYEELSGPK
jgi:hypothetical protein